MSLRSALITTATLASLACFAGQDPRIDYTFAAPQLDSTPTVHVDSTVQTVVGVAKESKRASISFKSASASDVLAWLQREGVSFIVDDSLLTNKRVTLNVANQPIDSVVDALASCLGGHWENRGGIRVFRKGGGEWYRAGDVFSAVTVPEYHLWTGPNSANAMSPNMDVFRLGGGPFDPEFAQKLAKELQEQLKGAKSDDPAFWEKFSKDLEEKLQKELQPGAESYSFTAPSAAKLKALSNIVVQSPDMGKLLKSLTPEQKALNAKQGYLKLSDLTKSQRDMLNYKGDGDVSIRISQNGDTLTIRSK